MSRDAGPGATPDEVPRLRRQAVDAETLAGAARDRATTCGGAARRPCGEHAERLGDLAAGRAAGDRAGRSSSRPSPRSRRSSAPLLERTAERIRAFAAAQRAALDGRRGARPGGRAGHGWSPVAAAGCYAPGGRFPLPSSVLMTAVTARAAGVAHGLGRLAAARPRDPGRRRRGGRRRPARRGRRPGRSPRWPSARAGARLRRDRGAGQPLGHRRQAAGGRAGRASTCSPVPRSSWCWPTPPPTPRPWPPTCWPRPSTTPTRCRSWSPPSRASTQRGATGRWSAQLADLPTRGHGRGALANGFAVVAPDLDAAVDAVRPPRARAPRGLPGARAATAVAAAAAPLRRPLPRRARRGGAGRLRRRAEPRPAHRRHRPLHRRPVRLYVSQGPTWLEVEDLAAAQPLVEDAVALARLEGLEGHARSALRRRR